MTNHVLYEIWIIMMSVYCLQGAVTGRLSKNRRGREYWYLSGKGRLICLVAAIGIGLFSIYTGLLWFA